MSALSRRLRSRSPCRSAARTIGYPRRWWVRQSLRARLTLITTALFSFAVATGAVLLLVLQRYALTRVLDSSAAKTARDVAVQLHTSGGHGDISPTTGGITAVQVLDADDEPIAAYPESGRFSSLISTAQLKDLRSGVRLEIESRASSAQLRVLGRKDGANTIVVFTDLTRVDDSLRVLSRAALIGGPLAVLLMGLITYAVVSVTLRPVAALRHGAADITAAGLAKQRLPVPGPQDEIHRLAVTLNAMLDRIDSATSRQRTFVGDAAHELRSPLASLRVQLEVGQRLGPVAEWDAMIDDLLIDLGRLDRLVESLLLLARLDESGASAHLEPVDVGALAASVAAGYSQARVAVRLEAAPLWTDGDPDSLRRVLINLINNATRYATSSVDVTVSDAGGGVTESEATLGVTGSVLVTVDDDGPGLAPEERERVFDRFYRVHESRSRGTGGTGLGLPIVRDIVRNHGGRVRLVPREDGRPGLRAMVTLPRRPPPDDEVTSSGV